MPVITNSSTSGNNKYLTIVNHNNQTVFAEKCNKGDIGAVEREYEYNNEKRTKSEFHYKAVVGKITNVRFKDDDEFGEKFEIFVKDDVFTFVISMNVASLGKGAIFAYSFLKFLPNIDLTKDVTLTPYNFVDKETGKTKTGFTVIQDNVKVSDAYYDYNTKKNIKKEVPPMLKKGSSKDQKTLHNINTKEFFKKRRRHIKHCFSSNIYSCEQPDRCL